MAELNASASSSPCKRKRTLKHLPQVDLTAMVDLAFLLITFFMLTTSLQKQSAMPIAMPVDGPATPVPDDRTMTVCLSAKNEVLWYMGTTDNPQKVSLTQTSNIRTAIQQQIKSVFKNTGKSLLVLVKPSDKSQFKNLVDVLDELTITEVPSYAIVDITSKDLALLKSKRAY